MHACTRPRFLFVNSQDRRLDFVGKARTGLAFIFCVANV